MARSTHQRTYVGSRSNLFHLCIAGTALGIVWFVGCSLQSFDELTQGGGESAGNGAYAGTVGTTPRAGSNSTGTAAGASGFGAESGSSGRAVVAGSSGAAVMAGSGGKLSFAGSSGMPAPSSAGGSIAAAGAAVGMGGVMAGAAGGLAVVAGAGGLVNAAGATGSTTGTGGGGIGGGGRAGGGTGGGGRGGVSSTGGSGGRTSVALAGASGAVSCPAFTGTGGTLVVPPTTDFETAPEVPWVTTSSLASPVYRVEGPGSACDGSWYLKCDPAVVPRQAGWDGPAIELLSYVTPGHKYLVSVAVRFDPQNAPKSQKNIGFTVSKSCSDSTVTQTYSSLLRKTTQTAWVRLDGQFSGDMPGCSLMSRLVLYVETDDTEKSFAINVDSFYLIDVTPPISGSGGAGGVAGVAGAAGTASAGNSGTAGTGP